jgi:phosphoglycolate phosphatase
MSKPNVLVDFLASFEVAVWDFDGVILDSNALKVQCMRSALTDFDAEIVDRFLGEFRRTFGRSRREHFDALHREYLGLRGEFEAFYEHYAGRYAKLLADSYSEAPLCAHAAELIEALTGEGSALFVVSGTLSAEADRMLTSKGLRMHFRAVLGGERTKLERIDSILAITGAPRTGVVLIGDSRQDLAAAQSAGISCLFVERYSFFTVRQIVADQAAGGVPAYYVHDLTPAHAAPGRLR